MDLTSKNLLDQLNQFRKHMLFDPGHFYSPIVNTHEIKSREDEIWKEQSPTIEGINLYESDQIDLIEKFSEFYHQIPFTAEKSANYRYYYENPFFSYSDGIFLYSFIKHYAPKKIIEVGSGFSSALILDTIQLLNQTNTDVTFIEPYPDRLFSLLTENDLSKHRVYDIDLQKTDLSVFEQLNENDILFIDSTHVSKTGSDVNYLLFDILPVLKEGVLIHFHDIFYPFEYPKNWVLEGRSWNENYILRSFLMYNNNYKIMLFSDFIHRFYSTSLSKMPNTYKNGGGSIWLKKIKK